MSVLLSSFTENKPRRSLAASLIATAVVIALLYYGREFFITLFTAITISFLLDPFVGLFTRLRLPRAVASFLVCSIALLLLYLMGLGLFTQVAGLMEDLPSYGQRINQLADQVAVRLETAEKNTYQIFVPRRIREQQSQSQPLEPQPAQAKPKRRSAEPPMPVAAPPVVQEVRIRSDRSPFWDYLYARWESVYHTLLMASFIPFLVYFMLSWRDHLRRNYLHLFQGPGRHAAGRSWQGVADMARAYVIGNFVLGTLLTLASGIFFWSINLPYFLLVAPLSGFLSLVPYVGLPLAILPPFLAALPMHDKMGHYIFIAAVVGFFHLLALNLLYPKLVGSRVHLNPMAVTVALMFWGSLWGAIGLVFAIPITAGIKAVIDNVPSLQPYGKLLGD
ncbi:MAG: AI-2E family transporter [Acidobacteriia bacterium]|nr:AI-2E family transporter [Terriglobia bacterium]